MVERDEQWVGDDPWTVLRFRLQRLRRQQGEPSLREIAIRTKRAVSHATVRSVLVGDRLPRWGQVEVVVEALDGNAEDFRRLWIAARDRQDQSAEGEKSYDEPLEVSPGLAELPRTLHELEAARTDVDEEIGRSRQRETDVAQELFEAREERADRDDEIKRLQARAAVDEVQRQYLEGEIGRLESNRNRLTVRIRELETALGVVQDDLVRLTQEKAELSERYGQLRWDWARHEEALREKLQREVQELRESYGRDTYQFTALDIGDLPSAAREALSGLDRIRRSVGHDALAHLHGQLCITLAGTDNPSALASLGYVRGALEVSSQLVGDLNSATSHLSEYIADAGF